MESSEIIYLYNPYQTPFGKLSPDYQDKNPIKYKNQEASSVISYAYSELVPKDNKGSKDYLLKHAKYQEIIENANNLFNENLKRIYSNSIKKAYNEKLKNPSFLKALYSKGFNCDFVYNTDKSRSNKKYIEKLLKQIRNDNIKNLNEIYLKKITHVENLKKYKIYLIYKTLESLFLRGIDDLSSYIDKDLDDIIYDIKRLHLKHIDESLVPIFELDEYDYSINNILNIPKKLENEINYAYKIPNKIASIIRILNYKKYNEQILFNDKLIIRRNYLNTLTNNKSEIGLFLSSLSVNEVRELDDRLYFFASHNMIPNSNVSQLQYIKDEDILKEAQDLSEYYEKNLKDISSNNQRIIEIIRENSGLNYENYKNFIDYILSKIYDPKYINMILDALNSVFFMTDDKKNFNLVNKEGNYFLSYSPSKHLKNSKDIKEYIINTDRFDDLMFLCYPIIKDILNLTKEDSSVYFFNDNSPLSPRFEQIFTINNFQFPTILHYAYYNLYKEIADKLIDYRNIDKSVYIYSHDFLLNYNKEYIDIDSLIDKFNKELYEYKSITLKNNVNIALEIKADDLIFIKLLISTKNKKLIYNNPNDNILGCSFDLKKKISKGENYIGKTLERMREELKNKYGDFSIENIDEVYYFIGPNGKLENSGILGENTTSREFDKNFSYIMSRVKEFLYIYHLYNSFFVKSKNIETKDISFIINNLYSRCYEILDNLPIKIPPVPKDFFEYVKEYSNVYDKYHIQKESAVQLWKSLVLFNMLYKSDMDNTLITKGLLNILRKESLENVKNYKVNILNIDNSDKEFNLSIVLHCFINIFQKLKKHNKNIFFNKDSLSFIYYLISSKNEKDFIGKYIENKDLENKYLQKVNQILNSKNIETDDYYNKFMLFLMDKLSNATNDLSRAIFFGNISSLERISPDKEDIKSPESVKDDFSDIFGDQIDQTEELAKKIRTKYGEEDEDIDDREEEDVDKDDDKDDDKKDEDEEDYEEDGDYADYADYSDEEYENEKDEDVFDQYVTSNSDWEMSAESSSDLNPQVTSLSSTSSESRDHRQVQVESQDEIEIKFNSKTRAFAEFSNFYPFVVHNNLGIDSIKVHLRINDLSLPPSHRKKLGLSDDDEFIECGSVEAAYMLGKYLLHVDFEYGLRLLFPARYENAKKIKSMGSKTEYVNWKSRTYGISKARAGQLYDESNDRFRAHNMALMLQCLWSKFTLNPPLRDLLMSTHNRPLHEIGRPSVWTSSGADMLGKLITHVRNHLRRQTAPDNVNKVLADAPKLEL